MNNDLPVNFSERLHQFRSLFEVPASNNDESCITLLVTHCENLGLAYDFPEAFWRAVLDLHFSETRPLTEEFSEAAKTVLKCESAKEAFIVARCAASYSEPNPGIEPAMRKILDEVQTEHSKASGRLRKEAYRHP
ncbi:MAG: hypothetical protein KDK50_06840 [Chlamydiia bacterium]|nr:hypothetical protein [Chlamydiia bacterium]MCB1559298.1 hypothetical protein [Alphaproteobacteria bacterium]HOO51233.1 hypothetical protein [Alphaproteobacteria bacterium]